MQTVVQGKEAVLEFLENDTLKVTNEQPGIYILQRDDAGILVLFFDGHAFIGSGSISAGGTLLDVVDGRVVKTQRPS